MLKDPILIVDDEVEMRIAMSAALKKCGYPVELSHNAIDAFNKFKKTTYSLVITDMTMPKRSGLELLKDIKSVDTEIPVILITAYGTIDTAVSAMKYGAFDYVQKPFDFDTFIFLIERALTYKAQQQSLPTTPKAIKGKSKPNRKSNGTGIINKASYKDIITDDPGMQRLLDIGANIATSRATVLIQSESGTGKELLARYIHQNSDRSEKNFVAINCAALPENLLESELFGHKKGAFTGAINEHKGKFEQANHGTILLDEISEMPLSLQAKLLRVLQEYTIDKVGGVETVPIDVRVIATTNRNLLDCVEKGTFREDLYFRLNVIPLELPPLRERKGDIRILTDYFVKKFAELSNTDIPKVSENVFRILDNYNWRGNIRELENVIERAVLLSKGKVIEVAHLLMNPINVGKNKPTQDTPVIEIEEPTEEQNQTDTLELDVGISLAEAEKQLIFKTLVKTNSNRTKAAEILGISIRTLRNKLNEYRENGDIEEGL